MIYATLDSLRCHTETDEVGADEPFVIVASVNLTSTKKIGGVEVTFPTSNAFLNGPIPDVDEQENHLALFRPFWGLHGGLHGGEQPLAHPDHVIFVAALMEHDDGHPDGARGVVAAQVSAALAAGVGEDRPRLVARVIRAVSSALQLPTGFPSLDEKVGEPQELRFTVDDLARAETGLPARQILRFQGDGGDYSLHFVAINRGQNAWRFCSKCRSLFFEGLFPSMGACPAGGSHAPVDFGFVYYLPHDKPGPLGGQPDWRFCQQCFAMYWAGDPANHGRCPATGGVHSFRLESFNFFLPHDHNGPGQTEWRFCDRCRVMFWNQEANKGVCAAGGGHRAQGFIFKLDFSA